MKDFARELAGDTESYLGLCVPLKLLAANGSVGSD